ncbi:PEP/pyruvate-binding domain-containing protein [Autumnicola psychrophila]|uniref:PEP/pyruvate-binding domain-containing protein n=1 Tax=Autumnicola psychrophila TaxID=3075592 RepID=A0ABU3DME5_9FLAO|nr:PEP/pyruvate-binding domain-containing protein [Zunongwangia sp. F225]MDT0684885.1 PEP/pyruvate-binding domain-containing protein [Zunongwangia sp. F225]
MICYSTKYKAGIGGKAEGLYKLRELGLQVPDFLVIPYENFENSIAESNAEGKGPEGISGKLSQYKLPAEDWEQLKNILQQWDFPQKPVVVRSSVLDEDGSKNAFPGVMDSFLNIGSYEALETAIANCAASAWSPRAMAYRKQHHLNPVAHPAVIVQQQIDPDSSGVLFTTFPNFPQEMAIHAVPGFAEGLMNGTAEGDEFYFLKKSTKLHRQIISTKTSALQRSGNLGLKPVKITKEKQEIPCMDVAVLEELFQAAQAAENISGYPLDIEFAVKEKELFILQARPITQEIPEVVVYDNSNIQESYCGVTTPLTFSFASRAYETVYRQTMQVLGLSSQEIAKHDKVLSNLLGLVKGRIYYNINNWYRGLQLLPSFKQNKADMELMMGLQEPVDFIGDVEKPLREKIRLLPGLVKNYYRLWRKFSKLHILVPEFQQKFQKHYSGFYKELSPVLEPSEFLQKKKALDENLLNSWSIPIINDFNVMMLNGSVIRNLKKAGINEPEEFLGRYLSGDQEIESTQPTIAMIELAEQAAKVETIKKVILALHPDLHQSIEKDHFKFFLKVKNFIHHYGDRTVGELKLETTTMRVDPQIFYKYLRNFLGRENPAKINLQQISEEAKAELDKALTGKSFFFKRKLRKKLKKLQMAIRYRERIRLERTRLFGMYRSIYRAYGSYLVENSFLEKVEDVFYLAEEELLHTKFNGELKRNITDRQAEYESYRKQEVPSRVTIPSPPVEEEKRVEDPFVLQGQGCYPGQISGEVVVIKDPGDNLDVNNKIICALRTDPGWAALLPTSKGVLIEKGSALSHSVILLRELGIPTIINIPNLCNRLISGEKVTMDGGTGEILKENVDKEAL